MANGRILAAGIPHATLHVYHGGHVELATRPSLLTPLITSFLAAPPHDARRAEQARTGRHPEHQGPRQAAAALRDAREQAAATEGATALCAGDGLTGRDPVTAPSADQAQPELARSHIPRSGCRDASMTPIAAQTAMSV